MEIHNILCFANQLLFGRKVSPLGSSRANVRHPRGQPGHFHAGRATVISDRQHPWPPTKERQAGEKGSPRAGPERPLCPPTDGAYMASRLSSRHRGHITGL